MLHQHTPDEPLYFFDLHDFSLPLIQDGSKRAPRRAAARRRAAMTAFDKRRPYRTSSCREQSAAHADTVEGKRLTTKTQSHGAKRPGQEVHSHKTIRLMPIPSRLSPQTKSFPRHTVTRYRMRFGLCVRAPLVGAALCRDLEKRLLQAFCRWRRGNTHHGDTKSRRGKARRGGPLSSNHPLACRARLLFLPPPGTVA